MFARPDPLRAANVLLALGVLILLAGLAGLTATRLIAGGGAEHPYLKPTCIDGKYGYVDAGGKVVIEPRFDGADTFSEGLALVLDRGRFGYIDARGAFAIPAVFRHALPFRNGFAAVRDEGVWRFLDRGGRPVSERPVAGRPSVVGQPSVVFRDDSSK